MANIMLTMAEIETLFHSITTLILGYTVAANPDKVRIGWNTAGAPAFKITENVTFLMITPTPSPPLRLISSYGLKMRLFHGSYGFPVS